MKSEFQPVVIDGSITDASAVYRFGLSDGFPLLRAEITAGSSGHAAAGIQATNAQPKASLSTVARACTYRQDDPDGKRLHS